MATQNNPSETASPLSNQVISEASKPTEERRAYMVKTIKQELTASVYGREVPLSLKDAADGCIGVSLWFDTLKQALDYADNDGDLISVGNYTTPVKTATLSDPETDTKGVKNTPEAAS